ncbi:YopX family protein [Planococcus halotolerans]|nr:YopX family protein [Planococcus halotolerans]
MREIKFNFYNTRTREYTHWNDSNVGLNFSAFCTHEHLRFLQYTGLKDKNGVEIFEGHILSAFYGTQLTSVKWNKEFGLYEIDLQLSGGSEASEELLGNHLSVVEVIGNIYENPELLKV